MAVRGPCAVCGASVDRRARVPAASPTLREPPLEHLARLGQPACLTKGNQGTSSRLVARSGKGPQSGEGELCLPRSYPSYLETEASVPAHDRALIPL